MWRRTKRSTLALGGCDEHNNKENENLVGLSMFAFLLEKKVLLLTLRTGSKEQLRTDIFVAAVNSNACLKHRMYTSAAWSLSCREIKAIESYKFSRFEREWICLNIYPDYPHANQEIVTISDFYRCFNVIWVGPEIGSPDKK